jgi:hypothetical protein
VLVATVQPSTALQLQTSNASSTRLAGIVRSRDGKFFLTDEVSSVGVELRGANLASLVGRRVGIVGTRVAGTPALADASQVVAVSNAALALDGSDSSGPSAESPSPDPSPGPPPSPPPPPPMSKGTKWAIVGGAVVVVGGTIGGLWAAGVIGGSSSVSQ